MLTVESASVPNALAALLLDVRDRTGGSPHIYFEWTEGNPVANFLRFLLFGVGRGRAGHPRGAATGRAGPRPAAARPRRLNEDRDRLSEEPPDGAESPGPECLLRPRRRGHLRDPDRVAERVAEAEVDAVGLDDRLLGQVDAALLELRVGLVRVVAEKNRLPPAAPLVSTSRTWSAISALTDGGAGSSSSTARAGSLGSGTAASAWGRTAWSAMTSKPSLPT